MIRNAYLVIFGLVISANLFAADYMTDSQLVFDDATVATIEIFIEPTELDYILANPQSDSTAKVVFVFTNHNIEADTVKNVGFRLRGTTSRESNKKSFKIDFNEFKKSKDFFDLEKMNLKAVSSDPSVARAKLYSDVLLSFGIPAARANHARLYINGDYYGLYINVEQIDENFLEAWFGNNGGNLYECNYGANLKNSGGDQSYYQNLKNSYGDYVYDLKNNEKDNDYSDLVNLIDVVYNTLVYALPEELDKVFDIAGFLRCMAVDVMTGNWDNYWYLSNNYYLYHNTETGRFQWIPTDGDETFGIWWESRDFATYNVYSWGSTYRGPLMKKLFYFDEFKNMYAGFIKYLAENLVTSERLDARIDSLHTLITPALEEDPNYGADYPFTVDHFHRSFDERLYDDFDHCFYGIKPYIATRGNNALKQLYFSDTNPIIYRTSRTPEKPTFNDSTLISTMIIDNGSLTAASVYYDNGSGYQSVPLFDDGLHRDGIAGDLLYGGIIPNQAPSKTIHFYVRIEDDEGNIVTDPATAPTETYSFRVARKTLHVYINEFMAVNDSLFFDEFGEDEDWVELYNADDSTVNVAGMFLTDDLDRPGEWPLPDTSIAPKGFLLIWTDSDPEQGILHADFKLNNGGEQIGLFTTDEGEYVPIDTLTYDDQFDSLSYGRNGDAGDSWVFFEDPTPGSSNALLVPVELENLSAFVQGTTVVLTWQTITESNNYGFSVQRSTNGFDFETIGFVKGSGSSVVSHIYSFRDEKTISGRSYYRLKQVDLDGSFSFSKTVTIQIEQPVRSSLAQNYPNPFNPDTKIRFQIAEPGAVSLIVYNLLGEQVRVLLNKKMTSGAYDIIWDGCNELGTTVSSGIYVYQLRTKKLSLTRKMALLR